MIYLLIVTFSFWGNSPGSVPMKLGPFPDAFTCQDAARQMKNADPYKLVCIQVPKGVQ